MFLDETLQLSLIKAGGDTLGRTLQCSFSKILKTEKKHRSAGLCNEDAVTAASRRPVPDQEVKLPEFSHGRCQEELVDVRDTGEGSGSSCRQCRVGGWASPVVKGELNPPGEGSGDWDLLERRVW